MNWIWQGLLEFFVEELMHCETTYVRFLAWKDLNNPWEWKVWGIWTQVHFCFVSAYQKLTTYRYMTKGDQMLASFVYRFTLIVISQICCDFFYGKTWANSLTSRCGTILEQLMRSREGYAILKCGTRYRYSGPSIWPTGTQSYAVFKKVKYHCAIWSWDFLFVIFINSLWCIKVSGSI